MDISAIVFNTKKSELLEKCLKSVEFAREIILVNNQGTAESVRLGRKYAAIIADPPNSAEYVELIREWGCKIAQYNWLLVLDGDEEVPKTLAKKLIEVSLKQTDVWLLPRRNMILGYRMQHTNLWPDYQPRFYRKGKLIWKTKIHEKPEFLGTTDKITATEDMALIHHNYQTVDDYLERIQKYTQIEAMTKTPSSALPESPASLFYNDFLSRMLKDEGYKDGIVGSFVAISQAYYQMVVAMRRLEKTKEKGGLKELEEIQQFEQDLRYWLQTQKVNSSNNSIQRTVRRFRRKIGV